MNFTLNILFSGFGPSAGRPLNSKDVHSFGSGYPHGDGISQPGVLSVTPSPISVTSSQPGNIIQNGRVQPPSLGGSSFLNRPISSGKIPSSGSQTGGETHGSSGGPTSRPSILAGRKPTILDSNKLIDSTGVSGSGPSSSSFGSQPSSRPTIPTYGSTSANLPDSSPSTHRAQPNRGDSPYGRDNYSEGRSPISGNTPFSGNAGNNQLGPSTGGQISSSPNRLGDINNQAASYPNQPIVPSNQQGSYLNQPDSFSNQPSSSGQPNSYGNAGGIGSSSSGYPPSTDVSAGLRALFKLPPGFCLVRCDTLRTGQISLTPDQIKDAFSSSGQGKEQF